jgi:hypothetical protein
MLTGINGFFLGFFHCVPNPFLPPTFCSPTFLIQKRIAQGDLEYKTYPKYMFEYKT